MTSISFYDSEKSINSENPREPHYKRPGALVGYTGHFPAMANDELHPDFVGSPNSKYTIRGYTGKFIFFLFFFALENNNNVSFNDNFRLSSNCF